MFNHDDVLDTWKQEFEALLIPPDDISQEQMDFRQFVKSANATSESGWTEESHNQELNKDFTVDEVQKIVMKAKSGKAPGLDGLMSDTFKNNTFINLLTVLFNACLHLHIVPTMWTLGLVNPIPKSSTADKRVPLNYRGISLLAV